VSGLQIAALAGAGVLAIGLAGCEEEPAAQVVVAPPAAPPPPPPPPKPTVTPIADLMAQLSIDQRVVLPEDKAPDNDTDRIAVLTFFDAFARGDDETLGSMMSMLDRVELEALVTSGILESTASAITEIRLETGPSPYGQNCALAVFEVESDYQPQLWYYTAAPDSSSFDAAPAPPRIIDQLYGDDWITQWHTLLEDEIALANELDAELEPEQVYLKNSRGSGGASAGGGSPNAPGFAPANPSGNPNGPHRRPPGKKRKPPGSR
jgi:hypothetical protein